VTTRDTGKTQNNASGGNAASLEALTRLKAEKAKGTKFYTFNTKSGAVKSVPLSIDTTDRVLDTNTVLLRTVNGKTEVVGNGPKAEDFRFTGATRAIAERNIAKVEAAANATASAPSNNVTKPEISKLPWKMTRTEFEKVGGGGRKQPWEMTKKELEQAFFNNTPLEMGVDTLRNRQFLNADTTSVRDRKKIGGITLGTDAKQADNFRELKKKISEEGIKNPVALYADSKNRIGVSDGTHRVLIAKELGQKTVPIQMTPSIIDKGAHKAFVKQALSEGKPVPAKVLKDYPDLAPSNNVTKPEISLKSSSPQEIRNKYGNIGTPEKINTVVLAGVFKEHIDAGVKLNKLKTIKIVADALGVPMSELRNNINLSQKAIEEAFELALVDKGREIIHSDRPEDVKFALLKKIYDNQPILSQRTSGSIANQQYSTPLPIAYLMGKAVDIGNGRVYEPTAGNGMLVMGASPARTVVNELDIGMRSTHLKLRFSVVFNEDALTLVENKPGTFVKKFDAVIMNPPFGNTDVKLYDGFKIHKLEHRIVVESLLAMKDDGKAAFIIGGHNFAQKGAQTAADRVFFNYLYSHYNVTHNVDVSGDLYNKQGTKFPIRIITIDGRKVTPDSAVGPFAPNQVESASTFDEVKKVLSGGKLPDVLSKGGKENGLSRGNNESGKVSGTGGSGVSAGGIGSAGGKPAKPSGTDVGTSGGGHPSAPTGTDNNVTSRDRPGDNSGLTKHGLDNTSGSGSGLPVDTGKGGGRPAKSDGVSVVDSTNSGKIQSGRPGEVVNTLQSKYTPSSRGNSGNFLTPKNLEQQTRASLDSLRQEVGDLHKYVMGKLDYKTEAELFKSLFAEQIDTVALAISNIENGKGIIVGDQTGVGKGRTAAAVIRYANKRGKKPIFITAKAKLFTDMYNDLVDIDHRIKPFLLSSAPDAPIRDSIGQVIIKKGGTSGNHNKLIADPQGFMADFDAIFTTYSQLQRPNKQRIILEQLAVGNIIILDESHTASGTSATGQVIIKNILPDAEGVVYLSATYAKRPDTLPVYYRTSLGDIGLPIEKLVEAIKIGGVPLQQVIAQSLSGSGQYVRKELDFSGVNIETFIDAKNEAKDIKNADAVTSILRDIVDFDEAKKEVISTLNGDAVRGGEVINGRKTTLAGVTSTSFSAVVHNAVSQMLLGLKADSTIKTAVSILKNDKKVLITLSNTMGSFLKNYINETGAKVGDVVDFSFREVLRKAAEGTLKYTVTDAKGDSVKKVLIPEKDFSPKLLKQWKDLLDRIDSFQANVPASPIDFIKAGIQKAGFSIGEITGRDLYVDYTKSPPVLAKRTKSDLDRNKAVNDFNSGKLDSILFNSAGATGLSMHASEKFEDKRKRHLIVTQADLNIDTFIQSLGRIFRTGQVVKPEYTILQTALPAEIRPAVVLQKKMASLNANTSANAESANTLKDVPDMLNIEGDKIVSDYLNDHQELDEALGTPLGDLSGDEVGDSVAGAMAKVTGKIALMPVATQKTFFADIEALYNDHIEYLNQIGENTLVSRDFDFQAEPINATTIFKGEDQSKQFTSDANLETVSVKILKKPFNQAKIKKLITETLGDETPIAFSDNLLSDIKSKAQQYLKVRKAELPDLSVGAQKILSIHLHGLSSQFSYMKEVLQSFTIGRMMDVQVSDSYNQKGVIIGIKHSVGKGSNPVAPSTVKITFAMADATQTIQIPLSKKINLRASREITKNVLDMNANQSPFNKWDNIIPSSGRENRSIVTGNLLAGFERFGRNAEIVNYTLANGGKQTGILLPRSLSQDDVKTLFSHRIGTLDDAIKFLSENVNNPAIKLKTTDDSVNIIQQNGRLRVEVPKSTKAGGRYFLNKNILEHVRHNEFVSRGINMVASVPEENIRPFLKAMTEEAGVKYEIPITEADSRITGEPPVNLDFMGFQSIYNASMSLFRRMFPKAADNVNIALDKQEQIGFLKTYLASPKFVKGKARFYVVAAKSAGHKQDRLRTGVEKRLNDIFKPLKNKKLHDEFSALQWMGDAEATEYKASDLAEMGVGPVVAEVYLRHRKLHNQMWRLLNAHRRAYGGTTGYVEGHVPHVFENWNVYEVKSEVAEKNKKGEVTVNRTLGGIVGSYRSLRQATAFANTLDPKKKYVVRPKTFTLPDFLMGKTVLKDTAFFRLVGKFERGLELTREEAMGLANSVSRRKNRRRFFGNLLKRTGQTGFNKADIHKIFSRYYNSSVRYIVLDDFKAAVIPKFERDFGVEHGRAGNALRDKTLALYIERYINDVGGVPTHVEDMLNASIKKLPVIGSLVGSERPAVWTVNSLLHATAVLKLGLFNLSSGLVNLTQLINTFSKVPVKHFVWANAMAVRPWWFLSQKNKNLLKRIGVPFDLGLANTGGFSITNAGGKIVNGSLFFFNGAEQLNRRVTALAAYRWAIKGKGMSVKQAILFARGMVDDTQFDYSVADTAQVFRNPIGRFFGQFKPFAIKEIEFMANLKGLQHIKFWIPMILMAGFIGIPMAKGISNVIEYFTGVNPILEVKSFLFKWAGSDPKKKKAAEIALYGVGAAIGVDISQRVGPSNILPDRASDFLGPTLTTIASALSAVKKRQGATQLIKDFSPSVGNFLTGIQTALNHGAVKDPFHRGRLKYVATKADIAIKMAGFRPVKETIMSDSEAIRRYRNRQYSNLQQKFIDLSIEALKRGDGVALANALARAAKHGVDITDAQLQTEMLNKALPQNVRSLLNTRKALRGGQAQIFGFTGTGLQ